MYNTTPHQRAIAPKLNMIIVGVAYIIFALSTWLNPDRWIKASAYSELAQIIPIHLWSVLFGVAGVLLLISPVMHKVRWVIVTSLTFSLMISGSWAVASFIKYISVESVRTTPVSWIAWLMISYIICRAAFILDQPDRIQLLVPTEDKDGDGIEQRG
jgi:hypothetical protein